MQGLICTKKVKEIKEKPGNIVNIPPLNGNESLSIDSCLGSGVHLESTLMLALDSCIFMPPIIRMIADYCACSSEAVFSTEAHEAFFRLSRFKVVTEDERVARTRDSWLLTCSADHVYRRFHGCHSHLLVIDVKTQQTNLYFHGHLRPGAHWSSLEHPPSPSLNIRWPPLIVIVCSPNESFQMWDVIGRYINSARPIFIFWLQIDITPNISLHHLIDAFVYTSILNSLYIYVNKKVLFC